jgi:hypothetical protein
VRHNRAIAVGALVLLAGCHEPTEVTVNPNAPPVRDSFFATWEIQSTTAGPLTCAEANAPTVDMDIVNIDSGARFIDSFSCDVYQGTSQLVDVGHFDVLLSLTDPTGAVLSQINVGAENVTVAGTIDLGHFIFQLP